MTEEYRAPERRTDQPQAQIRSAGGAEPEIRVVYDGIRSGDWQLGVYEDAERDPSFIFSRGQTGFGPTSWHEIDGGGGNRSFEEACIELARLALLVEELLAVRAEAKAGGVALPERLDKACDNLARRLPPREEARHG